MKMSPCFIIFILAIAALRTATGCALHIDCVSQNSLCFDGYCLEAEPLGRSCKISENCKSGVSVKENAGKACREKQCFDIKADKLCTVHGSCDSKQVCIRNHCVPAVATTTKCAGDALCGIGQRCVGGVCYEPQQPSQSEDESC